MSFSFRLLPRITRSVSPQLSRSYSSTSKDGKPKTSKAADKKEPTSQATISPSKASVAASKVSEPQVVEKGDTYKAGETYFNFDSYSFYELETKMKSYRKSQPSANEKVKVYCSEVPTPKRPISPTPRRLLPDPFGHMVEWPNKEEEKPEEVNISPTPQEEKPYYPIVNGHYKIARDRKKDPYYRARMPL
ncbi:uncharacterized protein LOC131952288 [Physella acuta]|uniref:uncharacterized protein LOC131952288 n=1 Tax=Physella acuta TaxID=109671 RepID=UPI0027DBDFCA|nr:uncharacterized protein LOC131952288 [Physella acuta]